ncbi:hypothetical protein Pmani_016731 [Petrolisthes manimaculis]|uniref:HAUS augmin-like complex subunit 7 n=1 Tax=Petrolisthes manimaculis TaxID=1843537 RepID=A0AAE1PQY3_9EUCA|nr:hypothetical protein Pmani_016731 [Petrolisthes manimaculis]
MAQTTQLKEEILTRVISQLETLGYDGFDSFEPTWVHSVLVSGWGGPRHDLLQWMVQQLSPSTAADLHRAPQHTHAQKILQCLSYLGICKTGDLEIIEGKVSDITQLKFWQACLDSILNLRQFCKTSTASEQNNNANSLLLQLVHSPHLQSTLQQGGCLNFVPGDLVKLHKVWAKRRDHTSLVNYLQQAKLELHQSQQQYDHLEEKWKVKCSEEEGEQLQYKMGEAVKNLMQQQNLLKQVYTSYIAPSITSRPQLELSEVGPLVHQSRVQLNTITEALQVMEELLRRCEELVEEELNYKNSSSSHTPSTISTLHTLTTTH